VRIIGGSAGISSGFCSTVALVWKAAWVLAAAMIALMLWSVGAYAAPLFSAVPGEMGQQRYEPAVVALASGKVLIAGGADKGTYFNTAEIYDPATGTVEKLEGASHGLVEGLDEPAYVLLPSGRALIIGGSNNKNLKTVESFDPPTNTFEKLSGELIEARDGGAAVVLPGGKVFVVGGYNETNKVEEGELRTAEIFDPEKGTWEKVTAEMSVGRYEPAVGLLPDGKVLIAGGYSPVEKQLKTAEVFDPTTGTFEKLSAEMTVGRDELAYTTLSDGKILLAGGYNEVGKTLSSAEVFNPAGSSFEPLASPLTAKRDGPGAALLPDGNVLIAGGVRENSEPVLKSLEELSFPPASASTLAASNVGVSTATLSGVVVGEVPSSVYFQYGPTTAYGTATVPKQVPASFPGAATAAIQSATVSGLAPGGTYHYRIVAEGAGGPSYGADQMFTTTPMLIGKELPPTPPNITNVKQSHSKWREGSALASISRHRKKRAPVGTTFSFTLSEQATVSLTFTQQVNGRKVKGKCVAQSKANKRSHRCTRTVNAGALSLSGHPGADAVTFQGSISASQKLKPGAYTLTIIATNATGLHSAPAKLTFTIVK
jgi:hypothetical protein